MTLLLSLFLLLNNIINIEMLVIPLSTENLIKKNQQTEIFPTIHNNTVTGGSNIAALKSLKLLMDNNNKNQINKTVSVAMPSCTDIQYNNDFGPDGDIFIGFLAGYGQSQLILGALPLAIEAVNRDPNLLPGRKLKFTAVDIGGRRAGIHRTLPIKFMTEMRDNNILAFIGPDETCTFEALVAAAWNLPMISYKCADTPVSNKNVFHSFARTLAPASKVSKSVVALLTAFNWHRFVIVAGERPAWGQSVALAIKTLAESRNFTVTDFRLYNRYDYIPTHKTDMEKIVDETYKKTRIYIFVGEHIAMVDFILSLQHRRLLDNGDYMVISVDDEIYYPTRRNIIERDYLDPYLKRPGSKRLNIQSFRSVLKLTRSHSTNTKFGEICDSIKAYSRLPPFSVPYHEKIFNNLSVPIYAAHLYDAVFIYARAATELLKLNRNIRDGRAIMSRIFNRSYHSVQGFDVHIDGNGDAEGNFTVIAMQEDSTIQNNANGDMSMQPVGYFVYNLPSEIPEFKYINNKRPIRWLKSFPPRAEPKCGFNGELCVSNKEWKLLLIGIFIALFIVVAGAFLIKHYRYEQTLACLLWKVDMKDVTLIATDAGEHETRTKNVVQICRQSIITAGSGGDINKRAYTTIGLYRGNMVAVKRIYKRSVDITRNIRKELKQMREVRHENIISFIGASVDHGYVAVLTSYCARGSLEDILANEDLFLDHMFISSLVSDILKGMIYLHESDIVSHGNLRSSNCLVDSRWVCQITDFGLHEFKNGQEEPNKDEREMQRYLFRAPELLRSQIYEPRGTQKGDVYSFGILLYEIVGRVGPWGETNLTKSEILSRLRNPPASGHVFRPPIRNLIAPEYVKNCLKACWDEDPDNRPDIRLVRVKLKEMQAGLKPNIFDNMLAIMEKYAYNLEGLVQERTFLLSEEKKKTETLLLRMLPKTVAESLKRGERVEAECFDCVTILFSDLVGFTEMCATSTPFEVVEMLNDLYTKCDSIISNYDVYKVETIGDAYMVVSGLPLRNGDRHVGEIASLALHLRNCVSKIEIRHRPGELLQIRIGLHSGQCVAGVVGHKMPRYCLFGDTVNTASRMESTGEPLKIHVSTATHSLLKKIGGYEFEDRGLIYVKGKGEMRTYWLISEDVNKKIERFIVHNEDLQHSVQPDLISSASDEKKTAQLGPTTKFQQSNSTIPTMKTGVFSPSDLLMQHNVTNLLSYDNMLSASEQQIPMINANHYEIASASIKRYGGCGINGGGGDSSRSSSSISSACYFCQHRRIVSEALNDDSNFKEEMNPLTTIDGDIYKLSLNATSTKCKCRNSHHPGSQLIYHPGIDTEITSSANKHFYGLSNRIGNLRNTDFPVSITSYRVPRSAPHITFMQ